MYYKKINILFLLIILISCFDPDKKVQQSSPYERNQKKIKKFSICDSINIIGIYPNFSHSPRRMVIKSGKTKISDTIILSGGFHAGFNPALQNLDSNYIIFNNEVLNKRIFISSNFPLTNYKKRLEIIPKILKVCLELQTEENVTIINTSEKLKSIGNTFTVLVFGEKYEHLILIHDSEFSLNFDELNFVHFIRKRTL